MSFFKFKKKEEFNENLCFSIMYGIRGVNKVTADGLRYCYCCRRRRHRSSSSSSSSSSKRSLHPILYRSVDVMAGTQIEYKMWTSGLKILCDMKLDPELAFIKNSFRILGKDELTLRETINMLKQINYRV
jgi:hypothetical protein